MTAKPHGQHPVVDVMPPCVGLDELWLRNHVAIKENQDLPRGPLGTKVAGPGQTESVALLGKLSGWDLDSTAWAASHSAAIAIAHTGTHHVGLEELREALART